VQRQGDRVLTNGMTKYRVRARTEGAIDGKHDAILLAIAIANEAFDFGLRVPCEVLL
jgi:hypothetical protein